MESISKIRVLLADDQQMLLTMYQQVLENYKMEIVAKCKTPEEAIEKYKELRPNVLLLDIRFGNGQNGFQVLEEVMKFDPHANVVVISQFDIGPYISRAYKLGAKSFLTKHCDQETLYTAVKMASVGKSYHMQEITDKIMEMMMNPEPDPKSLLSPLDLELFVLLAEGKTNEEISQLKNWKLSFVSTHRQKIQDILKIDRPQQLALLAVRHGLLTP